MLLFLKSTFTAFSYIKSFKQIKAQTHADTQTQGVTIHQINVPGLMSKIQLHRFRLLKSGQSWKGITAESMPEFLYQKSLI